MAYSKTIWKNRVVEKPRTFTVTNNPDGTITLTPSEGTIVEAGTPITSENMNKIEQGIEDAHISIENISSGLIGIVNGLGYYDGKKYALYIDEEGLFLKEV